LGIGQNFKFHGVAFPHLIYMNMYPYACIFETYIFLYVCHSDCISSFKKLFYVQWDNGERSLDWSGHFTHQKSENIQQI